MTMADTVAVMNHGVIEQMGPPEQLYELPRTAFVANFLGQSNLVKGTVVDDEDGVLGVDVLGRRLLVKAERAVQHRGSVVIGVRPEKVYLVTGDEELPYGANVIGPGTVVDVSFTGVSTQYLVEVPGAGRLTVFSQNLDGAPSVHAGDRVHLAWNPQHTFGLTGDDDTTAGIETDEARAVVEAG